MFMMTTADTLKATAQRIKDARSMTKLSQYAFAEKFRFSIDTLRSIESSRLPLSLKTATRLCDCFRQADIVCNPHWLLTGRGIPPHYAMAERSHEVLTLQGFSEDVIISEEIALFQKLNKDAVVICVVDDAMLPLYQPGDYIGGRRLRGKDIDSLLDTNCIVEFAEHNFIARRFTKRRRTNTYALSALNPITTSPTPLMETNKVVSAAFILWHRRFHP